MEKAFELGADGVLIVGCYEDRCHYDTGSQTSKQRVNILKRMMEQKGLDPRRLEKVHIYCSTSTNFVEASKEMVSVLNEIGRLSRD
jgi:F420-non-reducing hydrogenase iron-sulfur subunit